VTSLVIDQTRLMRNDVPAPPIRENLAVSPMGLLLLCHCGHGIGAHSTAGCGAVRPLRCGCPADREAVLAAAVRQAAIELQRAMPQRAVRGKP
jgi:hypothetical protein